ncbi:MAG TPA: 2-C-methyl-D-erythritol 2,4-cyclodiphosphate synthase [Actinomycetota bacterium]|nr:2-C-methyl-D-erythritol 2,4-cyclodiphosphate synthase [Actinomycetota bacterium]
MVEGLAGLSIGQGYDVHAFDEGRPLVIGGVTIPDGPGLGGHSDADVLCHAIGDALLGAARLGDLGTLFPGTDRWKDASSLDILAETADSVRAAGWTVVSIDSTIVAQVPRMGPHKEEMRRRIGEALRVAPDLVSVKATSTDKLGAVGRREGIAAHAVALLLKS